MDAVTRGRGTLRRILQTIINSASTGDTIVITGTCVGNFSLPGSGHAASLTLVGRKVATLDGNASGVVLEEDAGTLSLKNVLITNGNNLGYGGGIYNYYGSVTMTGSAQSNGNSAGMGAESVRTAVPSPWTVERGERQHGC